MLIITVNLFLVDNTEPLKEEEVEEEAVVNPSKQINLRDVPSPAATGALIKQPLVTTAKNIVTLMKVKILNIIGLC